MEKDLGVFVTARSKSDGSADAWTGFAQKWVTCDFTASAPEEHHVYSLTTPIPTRSSGAPCALVRSVYMPLLTERDRFRNLGL